MRLQARTSLRLVLLRLLLPALCALAGDARARAGESAAPQTSAEALLARVLPPAQRCDVRFLQHLGWRFERDAGVRRLTIHGGRPCAHLTLQAAQAAGALRLLVPPGFGADDARAFGRLAGPLADGVSSRAAYQLKVAAAAQKAMTRLAALSDSGRVQFPELFDIVHSPVFVMQMPSPEWDERGRLWVAARSAREALEAVYRRGAKADCYVGQLFALYGTQYELHSPAGFDAAFPAGEVSVGRPRDYLMTPVGRYIRENQTYAWRALLLDAQAQRLDPVLALGRHGPTAFVGLTGILCNQRADEVSNDNFMIYRLSARALDELVGGGGVAHLGRQMCRVWDAANGARGLFASPEARDAADRRVDALLATPAFSEFELYVQPHGIVTLADLVRKWVERTESPLRMRLYVHGLEDFFYRRYRSAYLARCLRELSD